MYRIGQSQDIHRLEKNNRPLIIGGVSFTYFPDSDNSYKNMDSSIILKKSYELVYKLGYELVNLDSSVIIERPKLKNHLISMRENIARILDVSIELVSVKAQTNERCGEIGRGEAMMATCSLLLRKRNYE